MTRKSLNLTVERLRSLLIYDPLTGVFRWRVNRGYVRAGQVAGCRTPRGYWTIGIDQTRYLAHRLAWLYVHGVWPSDDIDHRNEDKGDNRIANLREATNTTNHHNVSHPCSNNTSGYLGVSTNRRRWRAVIAVGRKQHNLGTFATREEAAAAYLAGKAELHPFWSGAQS